MTDSPVLESLEAGWSVATITERCRGLHGTLHARKVPTPELDAMAPGGAQNQTADPLGAAVVWYALLRARFELEQHRAAEQTARAQADVAAALVAEPVTVRLQAADAPTAVYPKSYHALRFLDTLDHALRRVVTIAQEGEDVGVEAFAPLVESLTVQLWAWILTHDGPELPFDEQGDAEPPAWTRALTPDDLLTLLAAHLEVNRARVARIAQLFPGDSREATHESRLSLAGFLGTTAQELGHRPFDLLRRWSVGEAFAQAAVAAQSAREARAAADEAAQRKAS